MFKDLPPNLVAAVAAINQTSRAAFMVEQDALRNKKLMQPPMPKQPAPKADPAAHPGAKKMAEGAEGTIAKTPREKELAAKHGHPKRITFGDVLKARGVTRQEAVLHPNQQKLDVHEPEKDELTTKDFKMLRANKKPKSEAFNPLKHIVNPSPAVKTAAKDVKRGSYADRAALMKAGGVKDDRGPRGVTQEEVEELDEYSGLSKSTLGSYAKKATRDAVITRKIGADFEHQSKRAKSPGMKAASDELSQKWKEKSWKRRDGVDKAVDRLTKEEVDLNEAQLIHFATGASSWDDNHKKVYAIHKSLRQEHPEKISKHFGGGSSTGYVGVKNKSHAEEVKAHIEKSGGKIVGARHEEGIKEEVEQTQEGWNDMMQASQARAEKEKTAKGTGKFNKQVVSTGTVYTRKASTFDDGGGKDADERKVDRTRRNALKQEAFTPSLSFKYYVEATGPNHLHVSDAGNNKYKVHSVGSNFSNGIKVGEHLTDTHLDDFTDMGGKITHVKPTANKAQPK